MRALDPERVEEGRGVVGEVGRREGAARIFALADAAQVRDHGAQLFRERRHLEREPAAAGARDALQQQQRRAGVFAVDLVVGLAPCDGEGGTAAFYSGRGRGWLGSGGVCEPQRLICLRSCSTPLATAFSVSKTPVPDAPRRPRSPARRAGSAGARSSSTGAAFGRSRLLYWTT